ncbi:MAG TPA: UvrD-helicase domain-containing protein [bacterium]|nr:UvrD-helicase domain-containing protein [bacterium]
MGLPPGAEQFRTLEGLNPEQRDAVATVGRHLAVEAGAGTGKTQVLTRRFVHLVLDHGVGVREILALTFTNRAAAQMQGRVRASFRERAAGDPDQAVRRRAQAALRELDSAYISTIHSFGARLLREFALEAGIDPRFRELDALEAEQLQFALADQLLAEWEADPARRQDFEALYGGVRWHRDTERPEAGEFAANFVRLYADVRCKTFGDLRFGQLVGPTDPPELQRALREAHGHFTAVAFSPSKANEKYRLWFELVQRLWQEASGAIAAGRYTEALALLHRIARESKQATNNELKPLKMFCSNDLVPLLAPWLLHQWGRPQRKALAHALLAFNASYQQAKDRLGVLDFGGAPGSRVNAGLLSTASGWRTTGSVTWR